MDLFNGGMSHPEFEHIAERLEAERPHLSGEQLDLVRDRARARAAVPKYFPRQKGLLMKPRLAVTLTLTLGMIFSGTGATLAVITDGDSAGVAQYPGQPVGGQQVTPPEVGPPGQGGVQGEVVDDQDVGGEGGVGGITEEQPADAGGVGGITAQPRQIAAAGGEGELPFTGILAIPLLVAGLVLLTSGVALRRAARRPPA